MAHRSEMRSLTNSDPATTAEQAEGDTHYHNGCEGGLWLQQDNSPRSSWLIMPPGYGRLQVCADAAGAPTSAGAPTAMDEWQRGQDREIWKSLMTVLHVGGGCVMVV